jgi:tetratricopeptide (TPR) repeat protein
MLKIIKFSAILLIFNFQNFAQDHYFTSNNIYRFAEYLYQEKEYLRAAGEYQRMLILADSSFAGDLLLDKIGNCYQLTDKYEMSSQYFQKIIHEYPSSLFKENSYLQIAYNYLKMAIYDQSINYIDANINQLNSQDGRLKMNIIRGMNYFYLREWKQAYDHFTSLNPTNNSHKDSLSLKFFKLAKEANQFPYKSKLLAGTMSAFIPGSGKMYAGKFKDGLYSFILIGISAWQSYDGFSRKGIDSFKGWAYGSLGTFFYLGNIYGSMVAVKIYNEKIEEDFIKRVELTFSWD